MLQESNDLLSYDAAVPPEAWEVASFRCVLPPDLCSFFGAQSSAVGISYETLEKLRSQHAPDWPAFQKIGELLGQWEYRGISKKRNKPLELYVSIDGIWRTIVIGKPRSGGRVNELVTFHRLRPSKVTNRFMRGEIDRRQK